MDYFRIVAGVGLTILILAAMMPWFTVTFLDQFNISLADLYRLILSSTGRTQPPAGITPNSLTEGTAGIGLSLTLITYPVSLILGVAAIVKRKITPFAGIVGIFSGAFWMLGVDSLKSAAAKEGLKTISLGGMITAEASSVINVGHGAYVAIIGGVIILVSYFITGSHTPNSTIRKRLHLVLSMVKNTNPDASLNRKLPLGS
ncbi:MAG: hypothetical protein M1503_05135 [Thaumarchaeota archaeon]|nr:hypothetical protein [Nitrososphaerota archaeon]MCL5317636.1 hypothetical protein [Nitrososphaerota archaeon]